MLSNSTKSALRQRRRLGRLSRYLAIIGVSLLALAGRPPILLAEPPNGRDPYIDPPAVTLHKPNGGECFRSGSQMIIEWSLSYEPGGQGWSFHIAVVNPSITKWWVFASNLPLSQRNYTWTVPSPQEIRNRDLDPDQVRIEVVLWETGQVRNKDSSDRTLRISDTCASPSPSPTQSPSPSPTRSPSPSPTRSPSPSPTRSPSPAVSPTATQPGIGPGGGTGGGGAFASPGAGGRTKPDRGGICPWWRSIFGLCAPEEVVCPIWRWIFGRCPPPGLNGDEEDVNEEDARDTTPPGAPQGLQGTPGQTSTDLTWQPPAPTGPTVPGGGGGIPGAPQPSPTATKSPSPSPTATKSPSPSPTKSADVCATVVPRPPGCPPIQSPSPTPTERDLPDLPPQMYPEHSGDWHSRFLAFAQSNDVAGYRIFRDGSLVGETRGLRFTDKGLTPNTTYRYYVQACDRAGNLSPFSNQITVKTKFSFFGTILLGPRTPRSPAKICPGN